MTLKLPRYWTSIQATLPSPSKHTTVYAVRVWGWSMTSLADAEIKAQARLVRARERAAQDPARGSDPIRGDYDYDRMPQREPTLDELHRPDGSVYAAITRNRHGVRVLNTERVMFVDIDLPNNQMSGFKKLFQWMTRGGPLVQRGESSSAEAAAIARVRAAIEQRPGWGTRVYRTPAGLRLLVTHALFEPNDKEAHEFMRAVSADEFYVRLCRARASFRARVSAKPHRIKVAAPPAIFPFDSADDEGAHAAWVRSYESTARDFAACHAIKRLGSDYIDPEVALIIDLHDRAARAGSQAPLA